jgi:Ca2+-binding RTX toxin-like protein
MPITYSVQSGATFPAPTDDRRVVVGDFDGDGDSDLIVQSGGNGSAFLYYRSNGDGTFTNITGAASPIHGMVLPNNGGANYHVADFDGDGDQDLWAAVSGTGGSYFRNTGGDFISASALSFPDLADVTGYAVGDFDGDGDADILGRTPGILGLLGEFVYWESNGDGTFTEYAQADSPFQGLTVVDLDDQSAHVADFDGDGDLDVWVSSALSLGNYFENNGDGTFSSQIKLGLVIPQVGSRVTTSDFDSDGDADTLAQLGLNGSPFVYVRSNGDGTFTTVTDMSQTPFAGLTLPDNVNGTFHVGDFDGDRDVDLWAANGGVNGTYFMQDGAPPALTEVAMASVASDAKLALTFTEAVTKGDGDIYLVSLPSGAVVATLPVGSAEVTGGGTDWLIDFNAALAPGGLYAIRFQTGAFVDVDGAVTMAGDGGEGSTVLVPAEAHNDAVVIREDLTLNGNVKVDNGSGADEGVTTITAVNGLTAAVGSVITLASGALLKVNANGTFTYNPNGQFMALAVSTSGATNTKATDSFTYAVNGGDTATVVVTVVGRDNADVANGSAGADLIKAGLMDDVVNGLDGSDTLWGQDGDDTLNGGAGGDKLYGCAGADIANGGEGNDQIDGGEGDDLINGQEGNDTLTGGTGNDVMNGGLGNDVYMVTDTGDLANEAAGEGYDVIRSWIAEYTLGANIESLQLQGTEDLNGTGNSLGNIMQGNLGANVIDGGLGVDTLTGGGGDDTLIGGLNNDIMGGGTGADRFVIREESICRPVLEIDTVNDLVFGHGDQIDLSAVDANRLVAGDQAFEFVSVVTTGAGQATLTYDAGTGFTLLRLFVDGAGGDDYQMRIAGDVTASSAQALAGASVGGWIL